MQLPHPYRLRGCTPDVHCPVSYTYVLEESPCVTCDPVSLVRWLTFSSLVLISNLGHVSLETYNS